MHILTALVSTDFFGRRALCSLFVLLVFRVAIMMVIFLLARGITGFAAISAAVLSIITLGFLLGTMNSHIEFL